jgi:predicted N-formylglutamate amidohydrolase
LAYFPKGIQRKNRTKKIVSVGSFGPILTGKQYVPYKICILHDQHTKTENTVLGTFWSVVSLVDFWLEEKRLKIPSIEQ